MMSKLNLFLICNIVEQKNIKKLFKNKIYNKFKRQMKIRKMLHNKLNKL